MCEYECQNIIRLSMRMTNVQCVKRIAYHVKQSTTNVTIRLCIARHEMKLWKQKHVTKQQTHSRATFAIKRCDWQQRNSQNERRVQRVSFVFAFNENIIVVACVFDWRYWRVNRICDIDATRHWRISQLSSQCACMWKRHMQLRVQMSQQRIIAMQRNWRVRTNAYAIAQNTIACRSQMSR